MQVVYLVFNEGYASSSDEAFIRHDLCGEAIRLGRTLNALVPDHAEVDGLLAMMLLTDARAPGRLARTATSSRWSCRTARSGAAVRSKKVSACCSGQWR